MKTIFMGTPDFAVGTLEALVEAGHEITLVVTQPDRPKGRGHAMQYPPVKEAALAHHLQVYQPERIRDEEAVRVLEAAEAEVIVVVAFGQLIPGEILRMKRYGCINVHGSLLPKYRGAAPIQWAVINGERESGVTTMQMDEGLDTGDILLKTVVPLDEKETGGSLFERLADVGARLCVETLRRLEQGDLQPQPQGEATTAYASMLNREMGRIDWTKDAASIERLIRGLNPWPSASTTCQGRTMKIWAAEPRPAERSGGVCGEILAVTKDALLVQTGDGVLAVRELQMEGRKRMDAGAFLRGFAVEPGTVLGDAGI